jgi:hypothetical protein
MQSQLRIVWVHFGKRLPKYLLNNLERAAKLFPQLSLNLISDTNYLEHVPTGVRIFKPKFSNRMREIEARLAHPKDFRQNFWFSAIARFDALEQFMMEVEGPIIHFESDILIARDFPFETFLSQKHYIAFPITSRERGIASTLFLSGKEAATELADFAANEVKINPKTSDMLILRAFYDEDSDKCKVLPIGPDNVSSYHETQESSLYEKYATAFREYGGVIDGNDFGVYFFGTDPRNARGKMVLGQEVALNYLRTSNFRLIYNTERRFVDAVDLEGNRAKIYSLHLTSKNPHAFSFNGESAYLKRYVLRAKYPEEVLVFRIFVSQALQALISRMRRLFTLFRGSR